MTWLAEDAGGRVPFAIMIFGATQSEHEGHPSRWASMLPSSSEESPSTRAESRVRASSHRMVLMSFSLDEWFPT